MTKPVTILKAKYIDGHTLFILRVNDGRRHPYGGIVIKGKHKEYSAVNNIDIHVKEFYNFRTAEKLTDVAKKVVELRAKGSWGKYPPGRAVFGDR
jgi:hypothetical protein